jgi:hypothetical protein
MKKPITLTIRALALIGFIFTISNCKKDPCLDLIKLESLRQEMVSWYPDTTQTRFIIVDRNGISQSMTLSFYYYQTENSVEDDCGNKYGSYDLTLNYRTSVSPLNFTINIRGSGNPADGFYISTNYYKYIGNWVSRTADYDLETEQSRTSNVEIKRIMYDNLYGDALEVVFKNTMYPTDIEKIYFAQHYGLISFTDKQGNTFVSTSTISRKEKE